MRVLSAEAALGTRPPLVDISYIAPRARGVLVLANDPPRRAVLAQAVERTGGRVVASGPLGAAPDLLDRGGAAVVVELCESRDAGGGAAFDEALGRLNAEVRGGRRAALVLTPLALLDSVVARIDDPGVAILIDVGAAERDAALVELAAAPSSRVGEEGEAENRRRLAQLGEEVGRIARALAALSGDQQGAVGAATDDAASAGVAARPNGSHAPLVRAILRLRRLRGLHFEPALFADPAWDILLDLFAARLEKRLVAVSSLCIAAAVPATTALRWIAQMTEQGLLARQPDSSDGRRVFIALSDAAAAAMDAYCAAAKRIVAPLA